MALLELSIYFFLCQAVPDAQTNGWKKPSPEPQPQPKSPSSATKPGRSTPEKPQQTPSPKAASSASSPDRQNSTPTPSKAAATPAKAKADASDSAEHRPGPIAYSSALGDSSPSSIRTNGATEHTSAGQILS